MYKIIVFDGDLQNTGNLLLMYDYLKHVKHINNKHLMNMNISILVT